MMAVRRKRCDVGLSCTAKLLVGIAGGVILAGLGSAAIAGAPPSRTAGTGSTAYTHDPRFPGVAGFAFQNVSWVAVAPTGEIYVLQRGGPVVSVWSPGGQLLRTWDVQTLGDPHSLRFQTLPDGTTRIWITDMSPPNPAGPAFGHCIKAFSPMGELLGSIGTCGQNSQGTGLDPVEFDKVTDIGFDSRGNAWITDGDLAGLNNRVLQIAPGGQVLQNWSAPGNQPGTGAKQFNLPHALAVDQCDRVWVADALNHRVQVIRTDGTFLQQLRCFGNDGVYGIAVRPSPRNGQMQLFATSSPTNDAKGGTVRVFTVAPRCSAPVPVPSGCLTTNSWPVSLSGGSSAALLHAVDAGADGAELYLAPLGGDLPPQRWLRVYLPQRR